jgi:hypothetical protein
MVGRGMQGAAGEGLDG